jgi:modulator of FtsH protease
MAQMSTEEIALWDGFAVMLGGGAAALAGLVFVAVSINVERIVRVRGLPGRAGESLILLVAAVCQCAFVLIPRQTAVALGIELLAAGFLTLGILLAIAIPGIRAPNRQPTTWHATRLVLVLAATLPVVLAGSSLLGWAPGGLYWLAAGLLCAVVGATANAWVLLVEVVRDERYRPIRDGDRTHAGDHSSAEREPPA